LARGRGEQLSPVLTGSDLHVVVAFPPVSLSTAAVYGQLKVPQTARSSLSFRTAFEQNDRQAMSSLMMNRLSEPALEILPQLGDLMESLWQSGLQPCQLTGSGSACFGIARDAKHAQEVVGRLRIELQPGVLLQAAQMVSAAAPIDIQPS
jgi:4-diphosphocytidyl-2-C-methyl-D-erythritol kinase